MNYVYFYENSYRDAYASKSYTIEDKDMRTFTFGGIGASVGLTYEYKRLGIGISFGGYFNEVRGIGIDGIMMPVFLRYVYRIKDDSRSFVSAGLNYKINFNPYTIKTYSASMGNGACYSNLISSDLSYSHLPFLYFEIGKEIVEPLSYGISAELPLKKHVAVNMISFSFFLVVKFELFKRFKYSDVYINNL